MKQFSVFLTIFLYLPFFAFAESSKSDLSVNLKGPLIGKNMYIPQFIHYNFPSLSASSKAKNSMETHLALYYSQMASYGNGISYADCESATGEAGFSWYLIDGLELGTDLRAVAYFPGVFDGVFEAFHRTFGFSQGGRLSHPRNQCTVDMPNNQGVTLRMNGSHFGFADTDLWEKYTFFENRRFSLAEMGAFKLPTGQIRLLSGSGTPELGAELLADFRAWRWMAIYAQAGVVFPFDRERPMFNGMAGLEIAPWKNFSLLGQINLKTAPITGEVVEGNDWGLDVQKPPQINTLVGFIVRFFTRSAGTWEWQLYIEEDPMTEQGTDLTVNTRVTCAF